MEKSSKNSTHRPNHQLEAAAQNCLLAVCDILGFSALVEKNAIDVVVNDVMGWFRKALHHSIRREQFPTEVPNKTDIDQNEHVGVAWFSDTVLLYTKRDEDEAVRQLITTVGWLIFENMLSPSTRLRAGLAYGETFIDPPNSMFVGKPIIEAHRLEQKQQWSGGALTKSACDRIPEYARSGEFGDWWVIPYDVPIKGNATIKTLAVNWNWGIHNPTWRLEWSNSSDLPEEVDWKSHPDICEKFLNTKQFHETFCHDCKQRGGA